jgi:hypothetical protein
VWQKRKARVRDFQTDVYFGDNLGPARLEQLILETLRHQPSPSLSTELSFNPEVAPWEVLFRQGELYERLPAAERESVQHHLEEIKVVLIKRMASPSASSPSATCATSSTGASAAARSAARRPG